MSDGNHLSRRLVSYLRNPDADRIDLVISDIELPGLSALEVLRDLGGPARLPPTILITAFGDEEVHRQVEEIGVVLLDKPFELEDLMERVREFLGE